MRSFLQLTYATCRPLILWGRQHVAKPTLCATDDAVHHFGKQVIIVQLCLAESWTRYAYHQWDIDISFSCGNLKACYIIDEDFINGGRAFVLFNLVATNWVYVDQINEQNNYWEVEKT
jgi:hypothetical protein